MIKFALDNVCDCRVNIDEPYVIDINYPVTFPDDYLRSKVRLEIGSLASWQPYEDRNISCYAAEAFPEVFEQRECCVKVIKAERTFWEKATILHHEAHRPDGNVKPPRYSRHYYDLARMARSPVKEQALANLGLLTNVVAFKQRFYLRSWGRYDLAEPGTLVLVPQGNVLNSVRVDYRAMQNMIFGTVPDLEDILAVLRVLQEEINSSFG